MSKKIIAMSSWNWNLSGYIGQKLSGYEGLEKSGILWTQITRFSPLGKQVIILTFILIPSWQEIKQVSNDRIFLKNKQNFYYEVFVCFLDQFDQVNSKEKGTITMGWDVTAWHPQFILLWKNEGRRWNLTNFPYKQLVRQQHCNHGKLPWDRLA